MNVIDIGTSYIKSYVIKDGKVDSVYKTKNDPKTLFKDTMEAFRNTAYYNTQSTIVISTSDSIVVEDKDGNARWYEHAFPAHWMPDQTPYTKSGHPCYDLLKGCANQMLHEAYAISDFPLIKRILPLSAYIATLIADNPDWNGWDITHATNSGFWDYTTGAWAKEAQAFIEAGLIDEKVYPCDTIVPSNAYRSVFLGGHDSVFSNANDTPYSSKPYVSCGTWTTLSVEYDMERGISNKNSNHIRYVAAPNGSVLKQICYLSDPKTLAITASNVVNFMRTHELQKIKLFGSWSKKLLEHIVNTDMIDWIEPDRFHGCVHLPIQAAQYAMKNPNYMTDKSYFCEGA